MEHIVSNAIKSKAEHIVTPAGHLKKIKASEFFGGDSSIHDSIRCGCSTERTSNCDVHESNEPKVSYEDEAKMRNSITFLNMTGDITITWDDENRDQMLELIRRKMADGYNFFTTTRVPIIGTERKVRVSKKNIDSMEKLVIPDAEFEKLIRSMNDKDIALTLQSNEARLAKRQADRRALDAIRRLEKAEDVLKEQSLAMRRVVGG